MDLTVAVGIGLAAESKQGNHDTFHCYSVFFQHATFYFCSQLLTTMNVFRSIFPREGFSSLTPVY